MTLEEPLNKKRDGILRIAQRYGARNLRVFGSVATDELSYINVAKDFEAA